MRQGSTVGCLATAAATQSETLFALHTSSRFRVLSPPQPAEDAGAGGASLWCQQFEALPDAEDSEDADVERAATLQREAQQLFKQLLELRGVSASGQPTVLTQRAESPSVFSFALANVLELELPEAQTLLECTSSAARLERQTLQLESAVSFAAAQKALQSLGGLGL